MTTKTTDYYAMQRCSHMGLGEARRGSQRGVALEA
jgi:hypothetical protein